MIPLAYNKRVSDIERRQANMVQIGIISAVDHKKGRYQVKFGDLVSNWIPDCQVRAGKTKIFEGRDIGEQVIVAAPSGDLCQGVIVGSVHTSASKPTDKGNVHTTIYPDGSKVTYDDIAHSYAMQLAESGIFQITINDGSEIKAAQDALSLKIGNSLLELSRKGITVQCGEAQITLSSKGLAVNAQTLTHNNKNIGANHKHGGIKRGAEDTGEPK